MIKRLLVNNKRWRQIDSDKKMSKRLVWIVLPSLQTFPIRDGQRSLVLNLSSSVYTS